MPPSRLLALASLPIVKPLLRRVCAASVLLSAGCGVLSTITYDTDTRGARRYALSHDMAFEVADLAQPLVDEGVTPGIVVGVQDAAGGRHYFGFGVADQDTRVRPDENTLFAIGSVSKGFLASAAAVLVAQGRMRWDSTLAEVLPRASRFSEDAKNITIEQLATHAAGLPREPMTVRMLVEFVAYLFSGESFYAHLTDEYVEDYLAEFRAPAARVPAYSNIGFGILAWVVQEVAGQPLDELMADCVLRPLSLSNTGYHPELLAGYQRRAKGYVGDQPKMRFRGDPTPDWSFTPFMQGSAALYSTARDLLHFTAAHLGVGDSDFDRAMADTLVIRHPASTGAAGLAWTEDEIGGVEIVYQIGLVAGYTTYIGLVKGTNLAVVVLQNTFHWNNSVGHRLLLRLAHARRIGLAEDAAALASNASGITTGAARRFPAARVR